MSSAELQLVFWAVAVAGAGVCAAGLLLWTRGRRRVGFALLTVGTSLLVGLLVLARALLLPSGDTIGTGLR